MSEALDIIATALCRLDTRAHVTPARLELSALDRGGWCAQIMADPLRWAVAGTGDTPEEAFGALAGLVAVMDWRRVRR